MLGNPQPSALTFTRALGPVRALPLARALSSGRVLVLRGALGLALSLIDAHTPTQTLTQMHAESFSRTRKSVLCVNKLKCMTWKSLADAHANVYSQKHKCTQSHADAHANVHPRKHEVMQCMIQPFRRTGDCVLRVFLSMKFAREMS